MEDTEQEQLEEVEALRAIYDADFVELSSSPPCFMIHLQGEKIPEKINLKVAFPAAYPAVAPIIELPLRSGQLTQRHHQKLLDYLAKITEDNLGMVMVYTLVEAAKEWIASNYKEAEMSTEDESNKSTNTKENYNKSNTPAKFVSIPEPANSGGRMEFVIGLIGKPSAGKSTFFNAATTQHTARMADHPFTTIKPNIGTAFYTITCPCQEMTRLCDAAYGHNAAGQRYVPVLLKDVAGLVPGACDGRGRGNRFLNDLLDADVLIHILDASGCTDENGEQTKGYDVSMDVVWLQEELFHWILDNIKEKWENIKRRPSKLFEMFTGYHANTAVISAAFSKAGIDEKMLSELPSWSDDVLNTLVRHFLSIRFPVYLVLNKCDKVEAGDNITTIHDKFPDLPSIAVSSKVECDLQTLCKQGCVDYCHGDNHVTVTGKLTDLQHEQLKKAENVFSQYGSTNVQRALSEAVRLKEPAYAFPVQCLDQLTSIDKYRGQDPGRLRDCIVLKPDTTVEQFYHVLLHEPLRLVAGDFVRAECLEKKGNSLKARIMRKDEKIKDGCNIIRIFTNKKLTQVKCR